MTLVPAACRLGLQDGPEYGAQADAGAAGAARLADWLVALIEEVSWWLPA